MLDDLAFRLPNLDVPRNGIPGEQKHPHDVEPPRPGKDVPPYPFPDVALGNPDFEIGFHGFRDVENVKAGDLLISELIQIGGPAATYD